MTRQTRPDARPRGGPDAFAWTERLFDPESPADGPPPERLGPFMRWLFSGAWPVVGLLGIIALLTGIAEAVAAWLLGWIVEQAADDPAGLTDAHLWTLVAIAAFFLILRPGLMVLSAGLVSRSLGPGLFHLGVWRLHGHSLGQAISFFEEDFTGRLAQKQMQTATAQDEVVIETMNAIGFAVAAVIGALGLLLAVDWRLALILLAWLLAYVAVVADLLPKIRIRARARADARSALTGQIVDSFGHMATVKLFAHARREEEAARASLAEFRETALDFGRTVHSFRSRLAILGGVLPVALVGGAILLGPPETMAGLITMAGLLGMRISQMSGWISFTAMNIFVNLGVVEDGHRTLARPHAITDGPEAVEPPRATGAIHFEKIRFQYGREGGGGIDGIDLSIKPGERLGLVGPSGAGKSTLVSLLFRLHDVEEGRILLDGRDIRGLTQDGLRRQISVVTQETAIFNRSALDNILYGRPDAGAEAAEDAARRAAAHDFIAGLRDAKGRTGYAAKLGERGVRLSGGQRQRIALARAILKDAPILVLDEATSALDSEVEAEIQAALATFMTGKTVIAIAHRLSTIAAMDRIAVMEAGRIVEEGSHDALLDKGGLYARLWSRQAGGRIGLAAE